MCGIGGVSLVNGENLDIPVILDAIRKQHHRGPDGQGHWLDENREWVFIIMWLF